MEQKIRYIDSSGELAAFCQRLAGCEWLAIDTEFVREKTYYPQLCLLQVAAPCPPTAPEELEVACIDPLALTNIDPLLNLLYDTSITKVLHAARQDMEILYHLRETVPRPLFDTQLAATLLGFGDQIGYGALVQAVLSVSLDKAHARTDWSARPLHEDQISYAADDVIYLARLYPKMRGQLAAQQRLEWLQEDFDALSDNGTYRIEADETWRRVAGRSKLKGVQLAALQQLGAWREREAQRRDKPRRWILADDVLLALARAMPRSKQEITRLRGLPSAFVERHSNTVLEMIATARELPKSKWPETSAHRRLDPNQEALGDALMALLRLRAAEHRVSPTALATRREIEQILCGDREVSLLHGWRAAIVGEDVRAFVEGRLVLKSVNGELQAAAP
ncbi:MAG: ribonuclease D [Pseudomonadota bacterium]|nr:MAG: ribonuclease D [Pseudomonadota bacterium]